MLCTATIIAGERASAEVASEDGAASSDTQTHLPQTCHDALDVLAPPSRQRVHFFSLLREQRPDDAHMHVSAAFGRSRGSSWGRGRDVLGAATSCYSRRSRLTTTRRPCTPCCCGWHIVAENGHSASQRKTAQERRLLLDREDERSACSSRRAAGVRT
jgi:hypothetical protein